MTRTAYQLFTNLFVFAVLSMGLAIGAHNPGMQWGEGHSTDRADAAGSPEHLIAEHKCWTGAQPDGVQAHAAIVTPHGATAPTYATGRLFTEAVEQAIYGKGHRLTVHAFCK